MQAGIQGMHGRLPMLCNFFVNSLPFLVSPVTFQAMVSDLVTQELGHS